MLARPVVPFALTLALAANALHAADARTLSLDERVLAQQAIERVYWDDRIWPPENPAPKPAFEAVVSTGDAQARVIDYVRESNALAAFWNRPITAEQLQAEMRRMAAESRDPGILGELFAALGNDPFVIAETLARQTLADRLIREAYAERSPSGMVAGPRAQSGGPRLMPPLPGPSPFDKPGRSGTQETPFAAWWAENALDAGDDLDAVSGTFEAVEISADAGCVQDSWKGMAGSPTAVTGQAVWTGAEMIVWGSDPASHMSGGRYVPAVNSWTGMSLAGAPILRYSHSVIWTGSEMIVWGGDRTTGAFPDSLLNDGGRYDPATDTWRPTTLTGAPAKRDRFTAVWSGREMIVWGGVGSGPAGTLIFNDGGRYDPAADAWIPVTSTGAPPARANHVGVWTGTEMIVWGGFATGPTLPRDFGLYNPATDTWRPGSTGAMPAPRYQALSVWTGRQMIVWGGEGVSASNTGGRYDPARDAWSPTSVSATTPAWIQGSLNAVWTGHEMLVWGGRGSPISGRYNPDFNSWVAMSATGSPIPWLSGAIWTGQEMIVYGVFGGTSNGYSGRYCASTCDVQPTLYKDFDHDGYGNPAESFRFCAPAALPGYVDNSGDCNDRDAAIHPGAAEVCDTYDNDCNGVPDDLGTKSCGVGACQVTVQKCIGGFEQECTPGGPSLEVCNGLDDDCNGMVDDKLGPGTVHAVATPGVLWPPNHRMVDVHLGVTIESACPTACAGAPPTVILASVSSSEPDVSDIQDATVGSADFDIRLRAERGSNGAGRTYWMTYTATDCSGVTASGQARVIVPHDRAGVRPSPSRIVAISP
jgi:hypothetical protein